MLAFWDPLGIALRALSGRLGDILCRLEAILVSWSDLLATRGPLGPFWEPLGALWPRFGALSVPSKLCGDAPCAWHALAEPRIRRLGLVFFIRSGLRMEKFKGPDDTPARASWHGG
eukprot:221404-Pyramimonas_sp.AAC.1